MPFLAGWSKRKPISFDTVFPQSNQADFPMWFNIAGDTDIASELSGGGGIAVTEADGTTLVPFGLYPSANLASGDVFMRAKFTLANEVPFLTGWGKRKAVKYATVFPDSNLTSFPQWFDIQGDADIAAELSGGGGITVTLADGETEVPFGLYPSADLASGDVPIRVKMDPLTAASTGDVMLYIYYDSGQTTVEDKAGTVSNGYVAFMPLEEDPSGSAPQMFDWVTESNIGTSHGSMTSGDLIAAKVAKGLDFDRSDDYIGVPDSNLTVLHGASALSVECWVKPNGINAVDGIVAKWDYSTQGTWFIQTHQFAPSGGCDFSLAGSPADSLGSWYFTNNAIFTDSVWTHISMVYNGSSVLFYADGSSVPITQQFGTGVPATLTSATAPMNIGLFGGSLTRYYGGKIDEVRVSTAARSAAWVDWTYQNEFDNANTFSLGDEEVNAGAAAATGVVFGYLYYDAAKTTTQDKAGTVDNGYVLFMPLEEDPSGGAPQMFDWVTETNKGTSQGSMTSGDLVTAQVAKGLDLDGNNDGFSLSSVLTTTGTEEIWIKLRSLGASDSNPNLIKSGSHYWGILGLSGELEFYNGTWRTASGGAITTGSWFYCAITHEVGTTKMYSNASLVYNAAQTISSPVGTLDVGYRSDGGPANSVDGLIDEHRVSNVVRSADWIDWVYQNEFDNASTFSLGAEESNEVGGYYFYFGVFMGIHGGAFASFLQKNPTIYVGGNISKTGIKSGCNL